MYWDPIVRAYWKKCRGCGRSFHGRKNKFYCNPECKAMHNNNRAAKRKLDMKRHLGTAMDNIRILEKVMEQEPLDVQFIHMDELEKMGFDSTAPVTRIRMDGESWIGIGDCVYMKHEDGIVEIMSKNWKDEQDNN